MDRGELAVGLIVDTFAGAGGASGGIKDAIGRSPDVAVNHWERAIDTHAANHPTTLHLRDDVWNVKPREDIPAGPVGIFWASPSCQHHSRAKSSAEPLSEQLRAQPEIVVRFARQRRPSVIFVENVCEFVDWGPLGEDGRPIKSRKGEFFRAWVKKLDRLGYVVEWRNLVACDYGAPTSRKRAYIIARCDGQPIVWPEPTHGKGRLPYETAASCIDWSIPCPSIFGRKKPLAAATERRIAEGLRRYTLGTMYPFVVPGSDGALQAPGLIQTGYGERKGQRPRALDIQAPLGTVVAGGGKHALVTAWLVKHFGGVVGHEVSKPIGAVTARDHHGLVAAHLVKFYGTSKAGQSVEAPLGTVTTKDRFALVETFLSKHLGEGSASPIVWVNGEAYIIVDIGMRMLTPRELARAMGFPDSYKFGGGVTAQTKMIGNAVVRHVARALVAANAPAGARRAG